MVMLVIKHTNRVERGVAAAVLIVAIVAMDIGRKTQPVAATEVVIDSAEIVPLRIFDRIEKVDAADMPYRRWSINRLGGAEGGGSNRRVLLQVRCRNRPRASRNGGQLRSGGLLGYLSLPVFSEISL